MIRQPRIANPARGAVVWGTQMVGLTKPPHAGVLDAFIAKLRNLGLGRGAAPSVSHWPSARSSSAAVDWTSDDKHIARQHGQLQIHAPQVPS